MEGEDDMEGRVAYETLARLANSCEREAARGKPVVPMASDLNAEDFRTMAAILRRLAKTIGDQAA